MFTQDEERDEDLDQEDDDLDEKNSDEEEDDDDADDKDEDSDEDEDDSDEDDKPVTRKELKELLAKNKNSSNAKRRVDSKGKDSKNDSKNRSQRDRSSQSPKLEERLNDLDKFRQKSELSERKRDFGYQNNLSPKQTDFVFSTTKRPTSKFLQTPHIKAALDAIKAESNLRENTPSGGGRNFKSNSGKAWEKMDHAEKQESFADRRRAILASKRG